MKLKIYNRQVLKVLAGLFFLCAIIISCSSNTENKSEPVVEKTEEVLGLELTPAQMKSVNIVIGSIEQKNLSLVIKSNGQLAVPPQNEAEVNVLTGGIIRKINVMEGQRVAKGQVLVVIENQELIKLQQDYLSAKSGFSYVDAEHQRQKQLKAANAGTGKSYQLAEANYNSELTKIKSLERQLQQLGISPKRVSGGNITSQIPVISPISGTLGTISAKTGSYVQPGTELMDIVDNSKIHADLIVYEKDLAKVKVGQKVTFQLTNQDNQLIEGEVYGINKSFEKDSKGVVVHSVIKKPGGNLIPGMYVTGMISVSSELTSVVPVDAVVRSEGKEYIFVVDPRKKQNENILFIKAEVTTGVSELGYIQITPLEKLPANARVVTKGAFYLQSKSAGGAEEE
jgi:membrane fusion protein, heavy metal efflux system